MERSCGISISLLNINSSMDHVAGELISFLDFLNTWEIWALEPFELSLELTVIIWSMWSEAAFDNLREADFQQLINHVPSLFFGIPAFSTSSLSHKVESREKPLASSSTYLVFFNWIWRCTEVHFVQMDWNFTERQWCLYEASSWTVYWPAESHKLDVNITNNKSLLSSSSLFIHLK